MLHETKGDFVLRLGGLCNFELVGVNLLKTRVMP